MEENKMEIDELQIDKRQSDEPETGTYIPATGTPKKEDPAECYQKGFKKGMMTMAIICIAAFFVLGLVIAFLGGGSDDPDKETASVPSGITILETGNESSGEAGQSEEASEADQEAERIQAKMNEIRSIIDQYYLFEQDPEWIEAGIYTGMMAGLGDVYSYYYTKEDLDAMMESVEGEYCGIGVMVSQDLNTGIINVVKVFLDSPAEKAGMLPEDMIVSVDGTEVSGMALDLVVSQHVKGEEGTPVTITVYRPSTGEYLDLTMKRAMVENSTVEYQMLPDHIGLVTISQFDLMTPEQFKKAIDTLQKDGMEKLIVDLRGNPGGVLDAVVQVMDYLLPDHIGNYSRTGNMTSLIYTEDKNGNGESYSAGDGHELDIPMAVLVNGNSASAAEVFAGAMQDYGWGTLVGTTTFGKGIVQNVMTLSDGSGLNLTVSRYYTPSGRNIHGTGIEPDVEVELDPELATQVVIDPAEDNQIQEAVKLLTSGEGLKAHIKTADAEPRAYTDGKDACTASAHMAVSFSDLEAEILDALENAGYTVWCQMDYASEDMESGETESYRSHMLQYVLKLKETITGYEMVGVDLDLGSGEMHYLRAQLSEREAAEGILNCFIKAAAGVENVNFTQADMVSLHNQMEGMTNGQSITLEIGRIQGQVDYYSGMYMIAFFPASE